MLLERDSQLALVREALRDCERGGSALLVTGPLGSGRSALLTELATRAEAQGVRVLRANAAPMERDFTLGVVRQLLDSLLAVPPRSERERRLREAGDARQVIGDGVQPAGERTPPPVPVPTTVPPPCRTACWHSWAPSARRPRCCS